MYSSCELFPLLFRSEVSAGNPGRRLAVSTFQNPVTDSPRDLFWVVPEARCWCSQGPLWMPLPPENLLQVPQDPLQLLVRSQLRIPKKTCCAKTETDSANLEGLLRYPGNLLHAPSRNRLQASPPELVANTSGKCCECALTPLPETRCDALKWL